MSTGWRPGVGAADIAIAYGLPEHIDTVAGEYTVALYYDEYAENPLTAFDQTGMAFYIVIQSGWRDHTALDTLDEAGDAGSALTEIIGRYEYSDGIDQDGVERRFNKWRAITGSPWILVTGDDSASRSDYYRWYVLADTSMTYTASDGKDYPALPKPVETARAAMEGYRAWAAGEAVGYVVTDPAGDELDFGSCWGFYDHDDAYTEGKAEAEADADRRVEQANLVGAGIVGIV